MDLLYQLALTLVPHIGDIQARLLVQHAGNATDIFREKISTLEKIEGIGRVRARSIKDFHDFQQAEAELRFIEQYHIKTFFMTDPDYPRRLMHCCDAPVLLFYKGTADLNAPKIIAIVGTRSPTDYGRQLTEELIGGLAQENVVVVSGLAYGIDGLAHKTALKNRLPTVGVVGHGLDQVYPYHHTALAKEMACQGGGILTEFFSGTRPEKHNFPLRNRIVAGLSDATVVIETHVKGGSMITAKLADAYHRDVFAAPGRTTDKTSSGCNHLIQYNKAMLLTNADRLMEVLGWKRAKKSGQKHQKELFLHLSPEEQQIVRLLQEKDAVHLSEIHLRTGLSSSAAAAAILNLELQHVVAAMPGNLYRLL